MHAYKDAIRRTGGAYILYPGTDDKPTTFKGLHEILPGLGAFAIRPSEENSGVQHLSNFINEIKNHFLNRASQRENIASKAYEITKNGEPDYLHEPIPEYINGKKLIPDDTHVLVGFVKDKNRLNWHKEKKLYNFRMNDENGSIKFLPEVIDAKYLLLRESGKPEANILYKLLPGVRVFSKNSLLKLNHPEVNRDHYLVYDIETESVDLDLFNGISWNFKDLEKYKNIVIGKNIRSAAGEPFTVTLTELMNVKI